MGEETGKGQGTLEAGQVLCLGDGGSRKHRLDLETAADPEEQEGRIQERRHIESLLRTLLSLWLD